MSAAPSHSWAPGAEVNRIASNSPAAAAMHGTSHDRGIGRRTPSVDGQADDVGARRLERLVEAVGAGTVVLHGDPLAGDALGEQELLQLGCRLRLGHPVGGQARLLDRAARLRPAGDDLRAAGCAARSSSSSPASSTASIQPRNPTPVVDHDDVGRLARSARASAR